MNWEIEIDVDKFDDSTKEWIIFNQEDLCTEYMDKVSNADGIDEYNQILKEYWGKITNERLIDFFRYTTTLDDLETFYYELLKSKIEVID